MDRVERQGGVSQLLLSPEVLERVVRDEKLNRTKPADEVAALLRVNLEKNIEVPNPIGLNGRPDPSRGVELFYLGYTDRDPQRARRVAHRRPTAFVDETSTDPTMPAHNTSAIP